MTKVARNSALKQRSNFSAQPHRIYYYIRLGVEYSWPGSIGLDEKIGIGTRCRFFIDIIYIDKEKGVKSRNI